eukprot:CAMPEP_0206296456 /NCGR_PEP_ID=MMETSP0106_2-20121207/5678_1 /ASSEMBLY_ACC=CAM_ASM_000206 /TAXON_ID=81532 /ORGANISM="Acanthoeca-like sp., Strain 10tr" /LENGTH=212 /DNA_ID=CAMNT_0053727115 /DNA_START=73 /DNA_END=711 /DNA_ORIENTATION=-
MAWREGLSGVPAVLTLGFFLLVTTWAQLVAVPPPPLTVLAQLGGGAPDPYFDHDRHAEYCRRFGKWVAVWGLPEWIGPTARMTVGLINAALFGWLCLAPTPDSRVAAAAAITVVHLWLLASMLGAAAASEADTPHVATLIETVTIEVLAGLHVLLSLRRTVEWEERWPEGSPPSSAAAPPQASADASGTGTGTATAPTVGMPRRRAAAAGRV